MINSEAESLTMPEVRYTKFGG